MEESICRLCLQKLNNENSFDIFPQNSEGVHENVILMRLAAVAAIEVTKFDALPKKICGNCRYQLELSYCFRKTSQISDAKLRRHYKLLSQGKALKDMISFEDDDQDEICADSIQLLKNFEQIRDEDLKKEIRKEVEAEAQELLEKFKEEFRKEITSTLRCEIEKEMSNEIANRLRSECLAKAKMELQYEQVEKLRQEESKAILGDLEAFLRIKQIERNKVNRLLIEEFESKNYSSEGIHEDFKTNDSSHRRIETIQDKNPHKLRKDHLINNQVQQISSCNNVMSYQIRIRNDLKNGKTDDTIDDNMENVAVVDCNDLDDDEVSGDPDDDLEILKIYNYESDDGENTKESQIDERETEEQMYETDSYKKSPVISYLCVDPSDKTTIGRSTTTPKVFKCKFCPVQVSTECSLQRHLRVHINADKSVSCPECKIVVSCSSALKRHMIIHSGERPYVCTECNKAFGQKEILKRHEDTQHKGLRYHKCTHCDQKFSQKLNLTEHIDQKHHGEPRKRYKCHLCSKSFLFSSGLSRHLSFHSGITYQCVECVRTFTDRSSIKRHVLKVHGVEKAQQIMAEIDFKNTQK